jgi:hypothetical protein
LLYSHEYEKAKIAFDKVIAAFGDDKPKSIQPGLIAGLAPLREALHGWRSFEIASRSDPRYRTGSAPRGPKEPACRA